MIDAETRVRRPTMERVRRRFERWRSSRPPFSPIPEGLWALAVEVAREHGVNATAHALHLNHTALKKRVQAVKPNSGLEGPVRRRRPRASFVELPTPPHPLSPCTIELENAQGAKLKIHLANPASLDWVALTRSFWDSAS
jgi:hypothetical protein